MSEELLDCVTMREIETLCELAFLSKAKCDAIEVELDKEKEQLKILQGKIQNNLEHFGKKSWDSSLGKIELRERLSVKTPKTEEEKALLFKWLTDKGIFMQTVSVNSQTLNALYNAEVDAALEKGQVGGLPGIGEPELYKTVILKSKK